MTLLAFICLLTFFILVFSLFKKDTDIFSPVRLFMLIWSLAIGLAELKLSRFQFAWSAYSWIVLFTCVGGTLLGMFIVYVINFRKGTLLVAEVRKSFENYQIDSQFLFRATVALFLCYILSYYVTYLIQGYIPYFTLYRDTSRTKWGGIFGIGLLIQAIPSIIYFIIIYFFFVKGEALKKISLTIILFATIVTYIFILQRYFFILILIMFLVCAYYCTKKMRMRNVLIFFVVAGVIIYGISSLRVSRYAFNILFVISEMRISPDYAFISEPYMYIVMNLENFARAVNHLDTFQYGFFTFDFILALTGLKSSLGDALNAPQYPYIITNSFNTYTMYFAFYRDFGIFGTGFVSLIFGALISALYYRVKRKPDLNSISIYAMCVFVLIFTFFITIISWLIFVFNVVVIYLVTRRIQNNKLNRE